MASIASSRTANAPQPSLGSSHPYTCNTCQVAFRNGELQRGHMHSDWHRYNLKRRVASLPPLSSEVFADKVLTAQASSTAAAAKASFEKTCDVCQRAYYSENAFQNHVGSQKHKLRLAALQMGAAETETGSVVSSTFSLGQPINTVDVAAEETDPEADAEFSEVVHAIKESSIDDKEPVSRRPTRPHHSANEERPAHPISPTSLESPEAESAPVASLVNCLFCNYVSPSMPLNVSHMGKIHGMFIPEQNYLVDLQGLIDYLREKVFEDHECLYCGKLKGTTAGAQTHMRDKGHCMIGFESEEQMVEIGQFYDFRSTYSDEDLGEEEEEGDVPADDAESKEHASGGVNLGVQRQEDEEKLNKANKGDEGDGEGWETDSSASSVDSAEITALPLDRRHMYEKLDQHPHHSSQDTRPRHQKDGWHSHSHIQPHTCYYADYELHLPSGRSVGHRSLARYYRQNLHHYARSNYGPEWEEEEQAITDEATSTSIQNTTTTIVTQGGDNERGRGRQQQQLVTRANGGLGMMNVTDAKKREVRAREMRERRKENRDRMRYQLAMEKQANSQKHFRDALLQ
ncbi:MAG: hypothetical protein M1816_004478 [Peltula sp. TS41687]|nr:MAG: hypothetical protein M1816_004478 [Peltula sp. TS41687]